MDFTLDEEVATVGDLAHEVFADHATPERVGAVEESHTRVDEQLWHALAQAGLLGIALPEEYGGSGVGIGAACALLEQQGRCVAPVPVWSATIGALVLATHGSAEQRDAVLPGVVAGSSRLTMALEEFGVAEPDRPQCTARHQGDGWLLTGTKAVVPSPWGADFVLVAATAEQAPERTGLFLIPADADGVSWERAETTSREAAANLTLDGAAAQAVGAVGGGVLDWALRLASVALTALQVGVARGALTHAANYLSAREQFGRPLGTFQAVQHQLADCYIDIEAMWVSMWQAVSTLEESEPDARTPLVALWWAGQAGLDVVHRVQHLHGGIGVDIDYPVHRHFLWGKQISGTLGGAGPTLERLGAVLADEAVTT